MRENKGVFLTNLLHFVRILHMFARTDIHDIPVQNLLPALRLCTLTKLCSLLCVIDTMDIITAHQIYKIFCNDVFLHS